MTCAPECAPESLPRPGKPEESGIGKFRSTGDLRIAGHIPKLGVEGSSPFARSLQDLTRLRITENEIHGLMAPDECSDDSR